MKKNEDPKSTKNQSEKDAIQTTVSRLFKQYDKVFKHLST